MLNQTMVVVQLLPELHNGGVERGTVEVANYLAEQGVKSIVISAGGRMSQQLNKDVEHICLSVGKKSLTTLLLIRKLRQLFIKRKVSIVHARSRLPAWLAYKAIGGIKKSKPHFVTTIHGLYSVKKYSSIMARADQVIAVSQTAYDYVKQNYLNYLQQEPQIIHRGVDPNDFPYKFCPDQQWLSDWRNQFPQLQNNKIVLLPGRLTELKGVKELNIWLQQVPENTKLVLTANPYSDKYAQRLQQWFIQKGVSEAVIWVGLQSEMAQLYAIADVVLNISTRAESFGRTVIESLSIGTPVIGYDHGGVGEVLHVLFAQGKVKAGDQHQLAQTINDMLHNPVLVENKNFFVLENMLEKTFDLYRGLLSES